MANPDRLFICSQNALDFAAKSASPALVSSMPMAHLMLSSRSRTARSVGNPATQTYFFTWGGQGYYFNFLSFYRHNFEPGVTWRAIGYTNADWTGGPAFDTGTNSAYPAYLLGDYGASGWGSLPLGYSQAVFYPQPRFSTYYFTRVLALSVAVVVTNPGVSDGYLDVSRAYGGDGLEVTCNPSSLAVAWKDDGKLTAGSSGSPRVDSSFAYRVMTADLPWVTSAQRAQIADFQRYAGSNRDVFVSAFASQTAEKKRDYEMIAKIIEAKDLELPRGNPYDVYSTAFKFREI